MLRKCCSLFLLTLVFSLGILATSSRAEAPLIPEYVAERHGLERAWFVQANFDRGRSRLLDLNLYEGILYSISDSAMVQAVDAETGAVLWAKQIGRPDHPCMPLGVGGNMLAVINGSRLYVANRQNGDILYEHDVEGAPGGGPGVNDRRVYVPMTTGMVAAYRVDLLKDKSSMEAPADSAKSESASDAGATPVEPKGVDKFRVEQSTARALFYQSYGRTMVQPLVLRYSNFEEYATWPTDRGYLYIARINRHSNTSLDIESRIKTGAAITVQPAYLPPTENISPDYGVLFFGSNDGFVTAIREDGVVLWRFPTTEPIVQKPVSIGDRVYFSTEHGGLYCVDAKPDNSGRAHRNWYAPGALRFLSASKNRVYAADPSGNTLLLDAKSGAKVDMLETDKQSMKFTNIQTDRLYLATQEGLIQCFHEIGAKEPLRYDLDRKKALEAAMPAEEKKSNKSGKAPAKEPKAKADETPAEPDFGTQEEPEAAKPAPKSDDEGDKNPFGE